VRATGLLETEVCTQLPAASRGDPAIPASQSALWFYSAHRAMQTKMWECGVQDSTPDDETRMEEAMHRAFSLAAQYIALAYALQPGKDVYAKSIQARGLCGAGCCPSLW